ncbi:phage tail tube protein [Pseudacidovorax sp. RU35E]|uniref:phage tail tube protein n=1 Tax=Pseudacidovorax sp. RU35E TaxID=1907403 RepID=UPI0009553040|nr:phage tail tube protein [Pseudacidovorax sp. RU35E]SIQ99849.1 Phage tail tube protein, TTP [Pseudacidovorax sp. RU35E]
MSKFAVPNGTIIHLSTAFGSAIAMTDVSNDNPAEATLAAAHGVLADDYLELISGWSGIDGALTKVAAVATNDVTLGGINTDTDEYPVGQGAGSVRKITAWQRVKHVMTPQAGGGEQQYLTFQFLEDLKQRQQKTFKNPLTFTFMVAEGDSAARAALESADGDTDQRALRLILPKGIGEILLSGQVSFNKMPTLTVNELIGNAVSVAVTAITRI